MNNMRISFFGKETYMNKEEIQEVVEKIVHDYGCCLEALGKEDVTVIEECEKEGHKKHRE